MKDRVIQQLTIVLNALDNISVRGKANLANLSGSISMLEGVLQILNDAEIVDTAKSAEK